MLVSDACQINDFDHALTASSALPVFQMPVRSMTLTTADLVEHGVEVFQMPVRSMTLTTIPVDHSRHLRFQMPVRSMTLTTLSCVLMMPTQFQMPVRSMTLTTFAVRRHVHGLVSDACQINDFDHRSCRAGEP